MVDKGITTFVLGEAILVITEQLWKYLIEIYSGGPCYKWAPSQELPSNFQQNDFLGVTPQKGVGMLRVNSMRGKKKQSCNLSPSPHRSMIKPSYKQPPLKRTSTTLII